jgi:hypothetical protein
LFDPTAGVEVSSLGSSSDGFGGNVVEQAPPIASDVLGFAMGRVDSLMEISLVAPSSSTWKLNNLKAISKPPVLAEAVPIKREMKSTVVVAEESMADTGVDSTILGDAVSTTVDAMMSTMVVGEVVSTTIGAAMPTMVGDAVSMSLSMADDAMSMSMVVGDAESTAVAGDEPSILVNVSRSMMAGEGAGESVDPDLVDPTVGAN